MPTSHTLFEILKSLIALSGILLCFFFMIRFIMSRVKVVSPKATRHRAPLSLNKLLSLRPRKNEAIVAILPVKGVILDQEMPIPGAATYAERFRRELRALHDVSGIQAVIVELSTPGGTVVGSANIAAAIQECSLPLFVYVEDMAASGGVWALTGADRKHVFAHPESILGSVGVLGPTVLEYNTIKAQGGLFGGTIAQQITGRVHSVGLGKAYGSPFADGVEKAFGAKMLDDMLQSTYERFLQVVSTARGIEPETLRALGASVMRAPEAKELGLVHAILTQQELEAHIRAHLGTQDVSFVRVTSERGKWSDLLGAFAAQRVTSSATPDSLVSVLRTHPALVYYDHDGRLDHG